ncbi:amidoligase family protein [Roseovarius sp. SK2]|uniref:amidoligase family protein n=1 Tax=Roseovarius TaxID=74030 RepID=UPI00237C31E9|nr:amidoligase family protein [Roseovarius sp. SK2]MDD9724507.1 amidoligase family protein [Roseovarius sp. SK2]
MTWQGADAYHFAPLPIETNARGDKRRIGIEVEFSGLCERRVASILQENLGGEMDDADPHLLFVRGSALGDLEIELDTALGKKKSDGLAGSQVKDLLRGLVPVEIVTPPLTPDEIARFDAMIPVLREAGASGSRNGVFLGFGVHLNVEVVAPADPHTLRTVRAFGLLDPVLRAENGIDVTRRVLPFVNAWPRALVDELVEEKPDSLELLLDLMDPHVRTRNHALDLLPLMKHALPRLFEASYPDEHSTKARPAFHFRLPDSRINEEGWSLQEPWEMWRLVEEVAATEQLEALEDAWQDHAHSGGVLRRESAWVRIASDILGRDTK